MFVAILLLLILFWFLGYGPFEVLSFNLITFNGRIITLWDSLLFLVILWLIGALPRPFREIASVVFLLWVLSVLGVIAMAGLSNILVIAIIVGLVLYILGGS